MSPLVGTTVGAGLLLLLLCACATSSGKEWVTQPPRQRANRDAPAAMMFLPDAKSASGPHPSGAPRRAPQVEARAPEERTPSAGSQPHAGTLLGTFRNTYYDFPRQSDHSGPAVALFDRDCRPLEQVPEGFHDAVCVQGSGRLARGQTVSFARRNCDCARTCPRTGQQICFDALDPRRFPWGRGASGRPIAPLRTVAVDSDVIPLGTPIFIPEYVGLPRARGHREPHDGCFVAEDRGIGVRGKHVDLFTGAEAMTRFWNELVPSNQGVHVYLDSRQCSPDGRQQARAAGEDVHLTRQRRTTNAHDGA